MLLRTLRFTHPPIDWELALPAAPEELIDRESFEADERMPYWADLWPSAMALARHLLDAPNLPPRAIELGCGVGLVSMALLSRGVHVLATDYEAEALRTVERNAERNDLADPDTRLLDWRDPGEVRPVPLVVAADVLYEPRHVDALANCLRRLVHPAGRALFADPGRGHIPTLESTMRGSGWSVALIDQRLEAATASSVLGTAKPSTVSIVEFRPPG